jgi:8-oxo-dGTP pyrophosphatase MutT (NUDIX family)
MSVMTEPDRFRRAGRALVLDPDNRVLLFLHDYDRPDGRYWGTPGGGLNDGESFHDAAQRELIEETGWTDVCVGTEVIHERTRDLQFTDEVVRQHDQFFLARVNTPKRELAPSVKEMHNADGIVGWRWWTVDQLDATEEGIGVRGLTNLIRELISGIE